MMILAKDYNKIEAKDNMNVDNSQEETKEVQERKNLKKVVDIEPKKRKKNLAGRLVSGVLGEEGLPGIGSYVNEEIIIPAIKNIIVDAVTSGINMVMYGRNQPPRGGSGYSPYGRGERIAYKPNTNYTSRYANTQPDPRESYISRGVGHRVEEYIIEDRTSASQVLVALNEAAERYDMVAIADYYDLIGKPSTYTDNNYGWNWESMSKASIMPVRGGYMIKFPPVMDI